jgi:hypothetical protein
VARTAVSVTLRVFVPVLLTLLAILFGPSLRRAASGVRSAGRRASATLDRAIGSFTRDRARVIDTEGVEVEPGRAQRARVAEAEHAVYDPDDEQFEGDEYDVDTPRRGRSRWADD